MGGGGIDGMDLPDFRSRQEKINRLYGFAQIFIGIVAVISAGFQIFNYIRGANPEMLEIKSVSFIRDVQGETQPFVRVMAHLSYLNTGAYRNDSILTDERVEFQLDGRTFKQVAIFYESFLNDMDRTGALSPRLNSQGAAAPVVVPGGGVVSHTTSFAPARAEVGQPIGYHFVPWTEFASQIQDKKISEIPFNFEALFYGGAKRKRPCLISTRGLPEQMAKASLVTFNCEKRPHATPE